METQENSTTHNAASEGKDSLIIASKTKEFIKSQGCQVSSDLLEALNKKVHLLLNDAVMRTRENKRTTVRPCDL